MEHLVAVANGGGNGDENCVACCKTLNALFGRMSLKEKLRVLLDQGGAFTCPKREVATAEKAQAPSNPDAPATQGDLVRLVDHLRKMKVARPATLKTLTSTATALFQKTLAETEIQVLLTRLRERGWVKVSGTKVTYSLPPADE